MLKIIHCADIHLGSKMEAKLPYEKAVERRGEVRATFNRMIEYAERQGVKVIILAGDVFDSDRPFKKDKEFFYNAVRSCPDIDFLYLKGNHDGAGAYEETPPENLKPFGTENWVSYSYGNVNICGLEICAGNALSMYSSLSLDKNAVNIVTLHGQTGEKAGEGVIKLSGLRNKNIDYLALGHIHSYSENKLDERGRWAYSGCLEGRGFDETGEKGFVLLEIEDKIKSVFVPFSRRIIQEVTADVTGAKDSYEAYKAVKPLITCTKDDLLRVNLTGEITFDNSSLAVDLENLLKSGYYFVDVKDKTRRKVRAEDYEGAVSLTGEFVRGVLASGEYDEERKTAILTLGLRVLGGGEAE